MVGPEKVVWSKLARIQLEKAYRDISEDSPQAAQKVKKDILEKASGILNAPERYSLDKYRKNNDGSIRAFEKHHYRIAYQIKNDEIRILRLRHTSRLPLKY